MPDPSRRRPRLAHLTTVDMSLALLLATELAVDVEAGFEVFGLSAPGPHVPEIERLGVTHVPLPDLTRDWDLRRDVRAGRQLREALHRLSPDILHSHNPKTGVLGRVLGRLTGVPIVVNTCHGLWASPDDSLPRRAFVYGAEGLAAQFSDAELYQNDLDRQRLQAVVPRSRSRTVGNGIDLDRFRPDPEARKRVRRELAVGDDELLVGGVGRRVVEKGLREFVAAARTLEGRARFLWVGPREENKPDQFNDEPEEVEFLGFRDDPEAIYAALDVFVLPSYREGFSRSAMEAAAVGCAMVLTDIRGCREIGTSGEHLLLVPPRDPDALTAAISRLLEDAELRKRLSASATRRAHREFDQRRVARASLETYRSTARRKELRDLDETLSRAIAEMSV